MFFFFIYTICGFTCLVLSTGLVKKSFIHKLEGNSKASTKIALFFLGLGLFLTGVHQFATHLQFRILLQKNNIESQINNIE